MYRLFSQILLSLLLLYSFYLNENAFSNVLVTRCLNQVARLFSYTFEAANIPASVPPSGRYITERSPEGIKR